MGAYGTLRAAGLRTWDELVTLIGQVTVCTTSSEHKQANRAKGAKRRRRGI